MEIDHDGSVMNEWPQVAPAAPSTSAEDVYQRAARAYIDGNPAVSGTNPQAVAPDLAAHGPFRAAVDEARRDTVSRETADGAIAALLNLVKRDAAELAAARAEIAAQAATITELRAAIKSTRLVMATSSRDWGESRGDAWLYGIYLGWDREPDEGEEDDGETAMTELATRHRWPDTEVARLRSLKAAVDALMGGTDD
jgi:hypothetical protein